MTAEDWDALADTVKDRRLQLGLTQGAVQDAGGPSTAKVREIENRRADTLSPSKRRDLERALQWAPGSIDAVLAGGEPTPTAQTISGVSVRPDIVHFDAQGGTPGVRISPTLTMDAQVQDPEADRARLLEVAGLLNDAITALITDDVKLEERDQFAQMTAEITQVAAVLAPVLTLPENKARYASMMLDIAIRAMDLHGEVLKRLPGPFAGSSDEPEAGLRGHQGRLERDVHDADDGAGQGA